MPQETIVTLKNEAHVRSPMQDTSQICIVLHDILRCLTLCHPLQEQNKTNNEVSHDSIKNMASP